MAKFDIVNLLTCAMFADPAYILVMFSCKYNNVNATTSLPRGEKLPLQSIRISRASRLKKPGERKIAR